MSVSNGSRLWIALRRRSSTSASSFSTPASGALVMGGPTYLGRLFNYWQRTVRSGPAETATGPDGRLVIGSPSRWALARTGGPRRRGPPSPPAGGGAGEG